MTTEPHPLDIPTRLLVRTAAFPHGEGGTPEERRALWHGRACSVPTFAGSSSQAERWQAIADAKREKSRARIATMKARMAERESYQAIPRSRRHWNLVTSTWDDVAVPTAAHRSIPAMSAAADPAITAAPRAVRAAQLDLFG